MNKIFNLYSAIETRFKPHPEEASKLKARMGITGPIILYVGRFDPLKGIDRLLSAMRYLRHLKNIHLVIIGGDGDQSGRWSGRCADQCQDPDGL